MANDMKPLDEFIAEHLVAEATRFLGELAKADPPGFKDLLYAMLVLRDSQDLEAVRLAGKAMLRNLQRLEDKLDDCKSDLEAYQRRDAGSGGTVR